MKDTRFHQIWNPEKGKFEIVEEKATWYETLSKVFAGLTYFGGLGISSGEVAESLGISGVNTGSAAEYIPLEDMSTTLFPEEPAIVTTDVDYMTPENTVIVEPSSSSVMTESEYVVTSEPRTSTPMKAGRPNINREPAVYNEDLTIDEEPLVVSSRGPKNNHELVYTKPVKTGGLRSGKALKSLFWKPVSPIVNEIEMEPLLAEDQLLDDSVTVFEPQKPGWQPKDGSKWGRWRKGNWSYGYNKGGRFHLRYKTAAVRWKGNKVSVRENGKWIDKEIPKSVIPTLKETLPEKHSSIIGNRRKGVRPSRLRPAKGKSPLVPYLHEPGIDFDLSVSQTHHKKKKKKCVKRRGRKCVKYDL